jgi:hypothetical protein
MAFASRPSSTIGILAFRRSDTGYQGVRAMLVEERHRFRPRGELESLD